MIIIGLTGSMGMGKSTAAEMLREKGIPTYSADRAVHGLLEKGGAGVAPVLERFPDAYDAKKQNINRRKLRDIIGFDHEKLNDLEAILHPLVFDAQKKFLREQAAARAKIVALDIPLLFETGAEENMDYVICVSAPEEIRSKRVLSRSGMTEDIFEFFSSRQMPDEEKKRRADFVVQTGNGLAETRKSLDKIIRTVKGAQAGL